MTETTLEQIEHMIEDGRIYKVETITSDYLIDTAARLVTRTHEGQNPREHDGTARTYSVIAVDVEQPIVTCFASYGWESSTLVTSIKAVCP